MAAMDVPSQPAIPPPQPAPPKEGCACCAMGCFSMFMIALIGCAIVFGGLWWAGMKILNDYTSTAPAPIQMEAPSEAQYAAANAKFNAVREAARNDRALTVEFTAADLNALIARHPDLNDLRGKFRVAIADSLLSLEMSVSLADVPLPKMENRWLN